MRRKSTGIVLVVACLGLGLPASAAFHLMKIVEVFPGTAASPNAQYLVLQMYAPGQNFVTGHSVTFYTANDSVFGTVTFNGDVSGGATQAKILVATPEAQAFFNVAPDLVTSARIIAAGGKACWDGIDCVAWGAYTGVSTGVGTPYAQATGLRQGHAAKRRLDISGGATTLNATDDTDNSATDFIDGTPAPANNVGGIGTIPAATCGNAALEGLEECDDGNTANGDGCSSACLVVPADPTLGIADAGTSEGNAGTKQLDFVATLSAASGAPITFDAVTDTGTATPGVDYASKSSVGVLIPAGQTAATFSVTVNGDTEVEQDETLAVAIANPAGAVLGRSRALGRILNDDSSTLSIDDATVTEGDSGNTTARFLVHLGNPVSNAVTFDVATSPGTATAGSDYTTRSQPGRVIDAGRTTATFEVAVTGDVADEPNETFNVAVTNISGATGADTTAVGTITDDDGAAAAIPDIQGAGARSPLAGKAVQVEGIVTGTLPGGFFVESPASAIDAGRSRGLAVRSAAVVAIGDRVRLKGRVDEAPYVAADAPEDMRAARAVAAQSQTVLLADAVRVLAAGEPLPGPVVLRSLQPADLERVEGMRVTLPDAVATTPAQGRPGLRDFLALDGRFTVARALGPGMPRPAMRQPSLRIEAAALRDARAIPVDTGDRFPALDGVLVQAADGYRLLAAPGLQAAAQSRAEPAFVAPARAGEARIAYVDMARVAPGVVDRLPARGSEVEALRLVKLASGVCVALGAPDLLVFRGLRDRFELDDLVHALHERAGNALVPGGCPTPPAYRVVALPDRHAGLLLRTDVARDRARIGVGAPRARARGAARGVVLPLVLHRDGLADEALDLLLPERLADARALSATASPTWLALGPDALARPAFVESAGWLARHPARRAEHARVNGDFGAHQESDAGVPLRWAAADPLLLAYPAR